MTHNIPRTNVAVRFKKLRTFADIREDNGQFSLLVRHHRYLACSVDLQ